MVLSKDAVGYITYFVRDSRSTRVEMFIPAQLYLYICRIEDEWSEIFDKMFYEN